MTKRVKIVVCVLFVAGFAGCLDADREPARKREEAERVAWEGPCRDTSWLLATTTGSPSQATCTNRLHRMRVEVASGSSAEEFGALVFCECYRGGVPDAGR